MVSTQFCLQFLVKWFLQGSFQASSFAMPELQESVILTKRALLSHTKIRFWSLIKKQSHPS